MMDRKLSMDDSPVSSGAMAGMKEENHSHGTAMSDAERDPDMREKAVGDERERSASNSANRLVLHLPNPTRCPPPPPPLLTPPHPHPHLPTMIQRTKMESGSGRLIRLTIATKKEPDNNGKEDGGGVGNEDASKKATPMNKSSAQSEWTPESITTLLRCYSEKFACGRGYLRLNDWQDVVASVNRHYTGELATASKTMKQCRDKLESLKRRYRIEKKKRMAMMKNDKQQAFENNGNGNGNGNGNNLSSWRYFRELDEMMRSQPKFALIPGGVDAGVKLPFADRTYDPLKKGKMPIEDTNGNGGNDNDDDTEDGYTTPSCSDRTLPSPSPPTTKKKKKHQVSAKKCKRSSDPDNPFQALADAVLGFADVFARIEMAKMEILTKMRLEMAKLDAKHRKTRDSSSLSSESE